MNIAYPIITHKNWKQTLGNLYTQSIPTNGEDILIDAYLKYGNLDILLQKSFAVAPTSEEAEQAKYLLFKNRIHPACYVGIKDIIEEDPYIEQDLPDVMIPRIDYQLYSTYGVKVRKLAKSVGISAKDLFLERLPDITRLENALVHVCITNAYMPKNLLGFWCSYLNLNPTEFVYTRNIQRLLDKYYLKRTEKLEEDRERVLNTQARLAIGFHTEDVGVCL